MVKKYMFYVGQRPKYTRTKVGAFAQLEIGEQLVSKHKKTVKEMLLLSCDEGRETGAKVNSSIPTYQLEYMYWDKDLLTGECEPEFDWIIGTDHSWKRYAGISGVRKFGIITGNFKALSVHGSSANLFNLYDKNRLSDLKNVTYQLNLGADGKSYYSQLPLSMKTSFFKIGNTFIKPINLQCNYKWF